MEIGEKPDVVMAEEGSGTGLKKKPGIVEAEEEVSGTVVQELSDDTVVFGGSRLIWKIIDPPLKVVAVSSEMALLVEEELTADGEAGLALSVAEAVEIEIVDLTESLLVKKESGILTQGGEYMFRGNWGNGRMSGLYKNNGLRAAVMSEALDKPVVLEG